MSETRNPLYMIRFEVDNRRFYEFAKRRDLLKQTCDDGYVMHSLMHELWGNLAPKPFYISARNSIHMTILCYSKNSKSTLLEYASAFADPACYAVIGWEHFDAKPMPFLWQKDKVMGFETRVCPIKRLSQNNAGHKSDSVEKDAYLAYLEFHASGDNQPSMSRFEFY